MAETNTDWKKHHLQNRYTTALRQLSNNYKQFEAWKSANNQFTTSSIKTKTDSQRGGTVQSKQDERINRKYDNGIAWNKLLITELQAAAFTTWKFRNKDIYGHSKEEEEAIHLQKLKTTVRREYERRLTYPTRIQWRYFTRTVSDRVNDTAQMLQAWYINLKTAIAANEERPIVAIGTG